MKKIISFGLIVFAIASSAQAENKFVDVNGKELKSADAAIAVKKDKNGIIKVYKKNKKEITILISDMKKAGESDKQLLDAKFWLTEDKCSYRKYPNCSGASCSNGTCKDTFSSSGFGYCSCR